MIYFLSTERAKSGCCRITCQIIWKLEERRISWITCFSNLITMITRSIWPVRTIQMAPRKGSSPFCRVENPQLFDSNKRWYVLSSKVCGERPPKYFSRNKFPARFPNDVVRVKRSDLEQLMVPRTCMTGRLLQKTKSWLRRLVWLRYFSAIHQILWQAKCSNIQYHYIHSICSLYLFNICIFIQFNPSNFIQFSFFTYSIQSVRMHLIYSCNIHSIQSVHIHSI